MTAFLQAWWTWIVPVSGQALILAILAAILDRSLARWVWPRHRALLWWVVLGGLVLPGTLVVPRTLGPVAPASALTIETDTGWALGVFLVWAAVAIAFVSFGVVRYRRIHGQLMRSIQDETPTSVDELTDDCARRLGLSPVPPVRIARDLASPAVVGVWRPQVVLPLAFVESGDRDRLRHVLLHELSHVRHGDPQTAVVTLLLQVIFWFHPAVWWACKRLAALREETCDIAVARCIPEDKNEYCRTMLEVADRVGHGPAFALGFVSPRSSLVERITQLTRFDDRYAWSRRLAAAAVAAMLLSGSFWLKAVPRVEPHPLAATGCLQLRYRVLHEMSQQPTQPSNEVDR